MNWKQEIKDVLVGIQYLFVAAGATILVPLLTGIPVSACLLTAGIGTLIFHLVTGGKMPVLLSSSFAFIAPIVAVKELYGIEYAFGGLVVAGLVYLLFSLIIYLVGISFIKKLFPTPVTATMVILIGLILAPVAIQSASTNWPIALFTLAVGAGIKVLFEEKFIGSLSVIGAIVIGTIVSSFLGLIDLSSVQSASIVGFPKLQLPAFSLSAISIIAPVAIVTFLEHFADVSAVGDVVEKDFLKDPGVHRTLIGDGVATSVAGLVGGCANTTYSENIGALEITGVKRSKILRITAVFLIIVAFLPKLAFLIHAVPAPVIGGISVLLFGLISANGIKSLVQESTDMKDHRNLFIVASMLVVGAGGTIIKIGNVEFSSLAIAALLGIVLNLAFNWKKVLTRE